MRIMGSTEIAHWGQCFEEFYGQKYCKYLRKDLEKLKDEFYDGNNHRFQSEWVIPTANLLRRLRQMGFPIRTQDHIIIHLYNPVDSMAAGETHFQVGRKAPGTLTLKFTKQNNEGVFVIQPKTLSNKDEMKLNDDPIEFLNKVRLEMKDSCLNTMTLLQTLVLMTDNCKLERQSIKVMFFGWHKAKYVGQQESTMNKGVQDCPSLQAPGNGPISYNLNRLDGTEHGASSNIAFERRFSETNYPVPWSFCVKNYVSYNDQNKTSLQLSLPGPSTNATCFQQSLENHLRPDNLGVLYRQSRSTTWHSEPEENDETMDLRSINEIHSDAQYGSKTDVVEDIRRSMADTKLWHQPVKMRQSHVDQAVNLSGDSSWMLNEEMHNIRDNSMVNSVRDCSLQTKYDRLFFPQNYSLEKYNNLSLLQQFETGANARFSAPTDLLRRYSEPRTLGGGGGDYNLQCKDPALQNRMAGIQDGLLLTSDRIGTSVENGGRSHGRTSLTEEYTNESFDSTSKLPVLTVDEQRLKGTFANVISAVHANNKECNTSATSPRTAAVDDYTGSNEDMNDNLRRYSSPFGGVNDGVGQAKYGASNDCDVRKTSSLDSYIGTEDNSCRQLNESIKKANSDCGLHAVQRTNVVTDYFQENRNQREMWQRPSFFNSQGNNENDKSSFVSNLNVPNISLLYKDVSSTMRTSSNSQYSGSPISWMSHAPISPSLDRRTSMVGTDNLDQSESALSHDSFPSWGSHQCKETTPSELLPVTIDEINYDV